MSLSNSQADRLGERLREGVQTPEDLRMLDEWRRSFGPAYRTVTTRIRELGYPATGRLAKSTRSIVEKLRRESIRLSQMQDIAGCRIVVEHWGEQQRCLEALRGEFRQSSVVNRCEHPVHGYRAIHVIPRVHNTAVEIQIRTRAQQAWAELSERSADILDHDIKYGGGPERWKRRLMVASDLVGALGRLEAAHVKWTSMVDELELLVAARSRELDPDALMAARVELASARKRQIRDRDMLMREVRDLERNLRDMARELETHEGRPE